MRQLTKNDLTGLLGEHEPPCISLYQPTYRHHPDNQQDPIRYRNLLAQIQDSLSERYPAREVRPLLEMFGALAHDNRFWNHRTDGVAIFGSQHKLEIFDLQVTVSELLVVADTFHIKPLIRVLQSADRFQVLALNRQEAKLYEGNRYALDPVELTNVPSTITEALGADLTEQHLTIASYGAGPARAVGGPAAPSVYAHGDKVDEVDVDRDRFFRVVDRAILEHHSRPSGLPLMLAALKEYHPPFRNVSHNPFLMTHGIQVNPGALSLDQLRVEAWRNVEPLYLERLAKVMDDYNLARSRQQGSDDLEQIAEALATGRVGTLLIEDNRQIPGKISGGTGKVECSRGAASTAGIDLPGHQRKPPGGLSDPEVDDILDDMAELGLLTNAEVLVVPAERMPTATGAVAIYRY